jgi:hypothetical protein
VAYYTDKEGSVSVFLGVFPSRETFDEYLRETWNEEGLVNGTTCPLWNDLGVTWLDHDFQEAHYQGDTPVPLEVFLSNNFSYLDSFRCAVVEACNRLKIENVNSGLFLYDFTYPESRPFLMPQLRFVGTFTYISTTPDWLNRILNT